MEQKLVKGALFLTLSSFIVKLLSFVYKVPYQNVIGNEGFYVFQQLYPFFTITVSSAVFAFPYVISNQINRSNDKELILKTSLIITLLPTLIFSSSILLFKERLAWMLGDQLLSRLFYPYALLLIFLPFLIIIRANLYSSTKTNHLVGKSILIEQFFRVFFILFIIVGLQSNVYKVGEIAFYGFFIGIITSLIYLIIKSKKMIRVLNYSIDFDKKIAKSIIIKALILLTCTSILLLFQIVDSLTIINSLTLAGETLSDAKILKSVYDRGLPIVQTAVFFVSPLLAALLPHANTKKLQNRKIINGIIYVVLVLALPAAIGSFLFMEQINRSLFIDNRLESVLKLNSINILLYSLVLTTSTIIEHKNNHKYLFLNIVIVIVIKLILNIILIVKYGVIGAVISSSLGLSILLLSNIFILRKEIQLNGRIILKILIANLIMAILLILVKSNTNFPLETRTDHFYYLLLCVLFGVSTYTGVSILLKIHKYYKPL
ncbi:oligosaccharide flippase family protein [Haloplasma contractile]|uniref:Polysaccharide transporter protein n=1 Tax=Haloplasma contractile SSD-17B TaxID=1033810 RepID=U2DVS3_9MOLU|nr:polysaccharide biosynthesis C-terminal domain-containing protein [Haloplasma contractile]ERJ12457.1 Polysaccharide transporter protein [Haloplasma contractile SSD-17B]